MKAFLLIVTILAALPLWGADGIPESQFVLEKNESPLIAFRIAFLTGSAYDPAGKEGVASLTASLISEGGTAKNEYKQILKLLFPMAAGYSSQVDKEMTVLIGVVHKDHLNSYYELFRDAILTPGFRQEDLIV